MYAVIATGGKQYRVQPGEELRVEKLDGAVGDRVELRPVLIVDDDGNVVTGADLEGRTVDATITDHGRGDKIRVFTYKNKSRQRRRKGHRQAFTSVKVGELTGDGKPAKKTTKKAAKKATEKPAEDTPKATKKATEKPADDAPKATKKATEKPADDAPEATEKTADESAETTEA